MKQYVTHLIPVIAVAIAAGEVILKVYATNFAVDTKTDDSPVTKADTLANSLILNTLNKTGLPSITEEGNNSPYNLRKDWESFWLVDPLDGTKEFVNRNGEFTVNIALIDKNKPLMGVIYVPVTDVLYFSDHLGAYKLENAKDVFNVEMSIAQLKNNSIRLPLSKNNKGYVIVTSRSHFSAETDAFVEKLSREHVNVSCISKGSSLKMCLVAEGRANAYPRFGITKEWDTAAGHAIVNASGGRVMHIDQPDKQLIYNTENLVNPSFVAYAASK